MGYNSCNVNGNVIEEYNRTQPAYNGTAVRIRPYWTQPVVSKAMSYHLSFAHINFASDILRRHTLNLDLGSLNAYNFILPFDGAIQTGAYNKSDYFAPLRNLISLPEENRLVVVFAHLDEDTDGTTVRQPDWLPFIIVDPISDPMTLVHELGHASRCAHVKDSIMEGCSSYSSYKNFHNIHAHEIYRSYWCTGPRPQNWSNRDPYNRGPYIWPPYDRPS